MKVYFLSQSLQNRAGSFDDSETGCDWFNESQSLQNRAGSFDRVSSETGREASHLNPFRIGRGLSTQCGWLILCGCASLNPFGTGQGLSTVMMYTVPIMKVSFNPFGAGQGLSTEGVDIYGAKGCFNPFGTGQGLSTYLFEQEIYYVWLSQSLQNRAGSFDRY